MSVESDTDIDDWYRLYFMAYIGKLIFHLNGKRADDLTAIIFCMMFIDPIFYK